jgi:hypothetical protein
MKYPIALILLFVVLQLSAQETKPLYSLSVLSPTLGLEKSMGTNQSFTFSIGNSIGYGSTNGLQSKLFMLRGEYRHYYN